MLEDVRLSFLFNYNFNIVMLFPIGHFFSSIFMSSNVLYLFVVAADI